LAFVCRWLLDKLPFLIELAFFLLLPLLLYRYITYIVGKDPLRRRGIDVDDADGRPPRLIAPPMTGAMWARVTLWVFAVFIGSRLIVLAAGQTGLAWSGQGGFFDISVDRYVRWDAHHYVRLARNWYVNRGDPRFHIVFFPLYPLTLRLAGALTRLDIPLLGCILSNIYLFLGGLTLYELTRVTYDDSVARRALPLFMLSPLSVFMSVPYGESLFVLTTLLSLLMARRRKFGWAVLFGALAANTRMLGILTTAPIFLELMDASMETPSTSRKSRLIDIISCVLMTSPVLLGLGAYILLNWWVTGNPQQFLIYQREHWGQQFGSIGNTMSYSLGLARMMIADASKWYAYTTWIPQVASVTLLISLLFVVRRRLHPGDSAYAWLYILAAISPTWLLSGSRYLMALYALYAAVALLTSSRHVYTAMLTLFVILLCYFSALYVGIGMVL